MPTTVRSTKATLNTAVSKAALRKISKKTTDQFLADLKQQGITSLSDLARELVAAAKSGAGSGVAFDPEDFPICYKFTTYRPRFDQAVLTDIVAQIDKQLLR